MRWVLRPAVDEDFFGLVVTLQASIEALAILAVALASWIAVTDIVIQITPLD